MRESSIVVRPQPMDSASYTASSRLQAAGMDDGIKLFEQAAREASLPQPPQPIAIADYGAATGYNSLLPVGAAIRVLRRRTRPDHAILVAHTDLPDNDFSGLFTTLAEDPDSYLNVDSTTFPSAVGRSFYQQILPSETIALGWSSWATHWLSRVPMPVGDHIHVSFSTDDAARRAYAQQAAVDWHDFLAFRGRELAPGGRLVVLTLGVDAAGGSGFDGVLRALFTEVQQLVADGVLTDAELQRMVVPTVGRSEADFLAPFAPLGRLEGLSVEFLKTFDADDRFWVRYCRDGSAEGFGVRWAAFVRAAAFPTLFTALDDETDRARSRSISALLESKVAARLAASPQPEPIPLACLLLRKHPRFA